MDTPLRPWLAPLVVFGSLLLACFVFTYVTFAALARGGSDDSPNAWTTGHGPKVGVIEVSGVITSSQATLERLIELRRDPEIKAIVLRIDSPGGAVGPSQEIYAAIQRTRRDKKVVASMGTVAASGGYYIASAADRIFASPGTITGSIGVITEVPEIAGLLDLMRVRTTTIKSGAMKDVGSALRPMTPEDRAFLQHFVDGIYEQFLDDVARARALDKEELRKIADGRILTGAEAKTARLIDELGNLEDAVEAAAKLAGAGGVPVPVFQRRGLLRDLMRGAVEGALSGAGAELRGATAGGVQARDLRY